MDGDRYWGSERDERDKVGDFEYLYGSSSVVVNWFRLPTKTNL